MILIGAVLLQNLLCPAAGRAAQDPQLEEVDEEVVVSSRRRDERLGDVPVSVTAVSAPEIEGAGLDTLNDLAGRVPNLEIAATGVLGSSQPSIRGVFSAAGAATVGFYIDDTAIQIRPLLFTGSPDPELFDVQRVEVLRGPQGTVFGAGSLGGTIRLITRQPDLRLFGGQALAEVSTVRGGGVGHQLSAVAGGPLEVDRLAVRGGIRYRREAGYVDRVDPVSGARLRKDINDRSVLTVSGAARARIGPAVTVMPTIRFQRRKEDDLPFFESTRGVNRQALAIDQPGRDAFDLVSVTTEAELDRARMTAVSSHFGRRERRQSDYSTAFGELVLGGTEPGLVPVGGTRNLTRVRQRNLAQELRLSSDDGGRAQWVVGAYYGRSDLRLVQNVREPGVAALVERIFGTTVEDVFGVPLLPSGETYRGRERVVETQLAAFGEASWRFAPGWEAFGGLRVSRSGLDLEVVSEGPYAGPNAAANRVAERRIEYPITPRLGLAYRPISDILLYVSASRGFRAGGANTPVPPGPCAADLHAIGRAASPASYGSDRLWSYEAGAKATAPHLELVLGAALFQIEWSDIQQQISLPTCGFSFVDNLGRARNRGFEAEAQVRPFAGFFLSGGVGFVDARFRRTLLGGVDAETGERALLVARGDRVPFTPEWTFNLAGEYRAKLSPTVEAFARADYRHIGAFQRTPSAPAVGFNDAVFRARARSDARLRTGVNAGSLAFSLFVDNLFDDRTVIFSNADLVPATLSPLRQTVAPPRTFGASIAARY